MAIWDEHPVCEVLDYLGLERNQANFEKFDLVLDWERIAENTRIPVRVAVCHVLGKDGKVIMSATTPIRVYEEVQEGNHVEELKKRSKVFIEWW